MSLYYVILKEFEKAACQNQQLIKELSGKKIKHQDITFFRIIWHPNQASHDPAALGPDPLWALIS